MLSTDHNHAFHTETLWNTVQIKIVDVSLQELTCSWQVYQGDKRWDWPQTKKLTCGWEAKTTSCPLFQLKSSPHRWQMISSIGCQTVTPKFNDLPEFNKQNSLNGSRGKWCTCGCADILISLIQCCSYVVCGLYKSRASGNTRLLCNHPRKHWPHN